MSVPAGDEAGFPAPTATLGELRAGIAETRRLGDWPVSVPNESTLRGIHFRRLRGGPWPEQRACLRFLFSAYANSSDVRFFNELLWIADEPADTGLVEAAKEAFQHATTGGEHPGHASAKDVARQIATTQTRSKPDHAGPPVSVALLGSPLQTHEIARRLRADGIQPSLWAVDQHPNKVLGALVRHHSVHRAVAAILTGERTFSTLSLDERGADTAHPHLQAAALDIGYHRLSQIIRRDLIDCFRIGILNDHWAALPFIRGRSSIEWTVLLSLPLAATVHFVEPEVDTGAIVHMQDLTHEAVACQSLEGVRALVKRTRAARAVVAIGDLVDNPAHAFPNRVEAGRTFYEMHPWIRAFVNVTAFPRYRQKFAQA